jgi:hypothetical protein
LQKPFVVSLSNHERRSKKRAFLILLDALIF